MGRIAHSPEATLEAHYLKMLGVHVSRVEVNNEAKFAAINRLPKEKIIALMPNGQTMSTMEFASRLSDEWKRSLFLIGGAKGLSQAAQRKADFHLALSPMVFSHLLTRLVLLEQLWRAIAIHKNHPYHR